METVMMQLGSFQFSLSTAAYQELTRSTAYRWPGQDRFGEMAALQFTGPGDDTISLAGAIFPEFRGGLYQLENLRELAAEGKPLMLVNGLGEILGSWVIEGIEERQSTFADAGVARRQDFGLKLRRYGDAGDDELAAAQEAASAIQEANTRPQGGAAVLGAASGPLAGLGSAGGALAGLANTVTGAASSAVSNLTASLSAVQGVAGGIPGGIARISGAINGAITAARSLNAAGQAVKLVSSLSGGSVAVSNVLGGAATLNTAVSRVESLCRAAGSVSGTSGPAVKALLGTQSSAGRIAVAATSIYKQGQGILGMLA